MHIAVCYVGLWPTVCVSSRLRVQYSRPTVPSHCDIIIIQSNPWGFIAVHLNPCPFREQLQFFVNIIYGNNLCSLWLEVINDTDIKLPI